MAALSFNHYKFPMLLERMKCDGHFTKELDVPSSWRNLVQKNDFDSLYRESLNATQSGQWLDNHLKSITSKVLGQNEFSLELMLAHRIGPQDEEHEGIWHDDGSRDLAFSLSLNENHKSIAGGALGLRKKELPQQTQFINTQPWGTMIVFHTGKRGWEHKITRVTHGNRLVLVGWLTLRPLAD